MMLPQMSQRTRDLFRRFRNEEIEFPGCDPTPFADFLGVKLKRAGERAERENLDEFVTGLERGAEL